jgi:hypothetical protein
MLRINDFRRVVPWRATVDYSSSVGFLSGSGSRLELKRINGKWVVVSDELQWISLGPNNSFKPKPLRGSA